MSCYNPKQLYPLSHQEGHRHSGIGCTHSISCVLGVVDVHAMLQREERDAQHTTARASVGVCKLYAEKR